MFENFKRKRKIKKFARKLPKTLVALFGKNECYSKGQVDRALKDRFSKYRNSSMSSNEFLYAYAMFCSPLAFSDIQNELNTSCDYASLREEIALVCFNNTNDFSFTLLEAMAANDSGGFSMGSSDGGSFSDGGGGGGE